MRTRAAAVKAARMFLSRPKFPDSCPPTNNPATSVTFQPPPQPCLATEPVLVLVPVPVVVLGLQLGPLAREPVLAGTVIVVAVLPSTADPLLGASTSTSTTS
jgi:hypothetical protein